MKMFTKYEKCTSVTKRSDMTVSSHCFIRYKMAPIWILMLILHTNDSQDVNRVDNFALISGTLRTFQRAKCDEELVTLTCPKGTTISIQFAQYGKSGASKTLCPPIQTPTYHHEDVMASRRGLYHYQTQPTNIVNSSNNITCIWPSALQTVVEACHKKRQCKFHPSTHTFGGDPCPGVRKFVEVAYKCRPYEFLSETACENDKIQLECDMNHRVAVFSASYGRTEYESVHCPQPKGVAEESCMVSFATEAVMNLCHGKRRCTLTADTATFGNPCRPASRMYLKVVYTCVPRTVLKEMYDSPLEEDEQDTVISVEEPIEDYDRSTPVDQEFYQESFAQPPVTKIEVNRYNTNMNNNNNNNYTRISPQVTSTGTPSHRRTKDFDTTNSEMSSIPKVFKNQSQLFPSYPSKNQYTSSTTDQSMQGDSESKAMNDGDQPFNKITSGVLGIVVFVTQNQERFYLIVIISVSICIVIVLGLLGAHFIMSRRQTNHDDGKYQSSGGEHNMPREFVDDISDINDDIALGTPLPINSANTLPRSNSAGMQTNIMIPPQNASPIVDHTNGSGGMIGGGGGLQRNTMPGGGGGNVFAVSTFGIDERHHQHVHQHPPGAGHIGYVIPPPDAYQTFQRHHSQRGGEDLPRGLARAPDSHYFYG